MSGLRMQTIKKIGGGILLGGTVFLLVLLAGESFLRIPSWLKVAGRMHPLFLHFPIVLLLISFIIVWLPLPGKEENEWLDLLRLTAALSAVLTAIMGLLLSLENGKSGAVLQWHKWGGIALALSGSLFYLFYHFFDSQRALGKLFTTFVAALILLTSHWGGNLTHGDNYILAPMDVERKVTPDQALVFVDVIRPILEKKCFSCHGGSVSKGGLSMETMVGMLKGGRTGPVFIPGSPENSLLIERIHWPLEEKKHMPPAAKPQLTAGEATLLTAWIRSGAPDDKRLASLPAGDSFRLLATSSLTAQDEAAEDAPRYNFPAADEKTIAALNNNYRVIEPQGLHSPALAVYFYGKAMYSGTALEQLLPLKAQILTLGLARMPVKDEQLKTIGQMPNLRKLNLDYTDITPAGLSYLTGLKNLQQLDLSGTDLTAAGLEKVLDLPELYSVVIWNTKLDSTQVAVLEARHKKVHLETGFIDKGQLTVTLSPPTIDTPSTVYDKDLRITMRHPFRGVDIRYTLDGSRPDSLNSALYKGPVTVDSNVRLVARAFKKGWEGSTSVRALYLRRACKPDSIELVNLPDPKYKGGGGVLSDKNLGDANTDDQQWLGYQKKPAVFYMYFDTAIRTRSVLLNIMENTGDHIFPPQTIEVWGGPDKNKLRLLGSLHPAQPTRDTGELRLPIKVEFAWTAVRCLKIIAVPMPKSPIKPLPKVPPTPAEKAEAAKQAAAAKATALKEAKSKPAAPPDNKPKKPEPGWVLISEVAVD